MAEETAEKSQPASQHRRQQARESGQFAKSQELVSAAILLAAVASLYWFGQSAVVGLQNFIEFQLGSPGALSVDQQSAISTWQQTLRMLALIVLPMLGITLMMAVLFNVFQTGLLWRPQTLAPDLSRVNPATGLRRMFSIANFGRLLFAMIKIVVVAAVAFRSLSNEHETILGLAMLDTPQLALLLSRTVLWIALQVAAVLFGLALLDYAFQWWRHEQGLKMTNAEVREELRNLQGDPQMAARRRIVQRERLQVRPEMTVPKAHLVVAQGSTLCVAIRYDAASMPAPLIVAKGSGALATRIGRLALEHGVPIVEDQGLAQLLDKEGAINQAIPRRLFAPVADLLARAFQRSGRQSLSRDAAAIR